jgi:hypothetical protein
VVSKVLDSVFARWDLPQDAWDLSIDVNRGHDQSSVNENSLRCRREESVSLEEPVLQTHAKTEKEGSVSGDLITALRVAEFINSL